LPAIRLMPNIFPLGNRSEAVVGRLRGVGLTSRAWNRRAEQGRGGASTILKFLNERDELGSLRISLSRLRANRARPGFADLWSFGNLIDQCHATAPNLEIVWV